MSAKHQPDPPWQRRQLLREMGLSPQWRLRQQPAVRRQPPVEVAAVARAGLVQRAVEQARPVRGSGSADPSPPTRAEQIARLGWHELSASVAGCRACSLCEQRRQAVLGVGDRGADWLFVGEGPGAEEDARGEPFVGPAGKLLDAMLAAIDLQRGEDVYIANAVKCRPPSNRTPEAAEMAACAPYLRRQIELIQPRLIVLLGRAAAHALLGDVGSLAGLRGRPLEYREGTGSGSAIPVVVTYHPAYLLRTLPDKAKAWEDLCRARTLMRTAKGAITQSA